MGQERMRVGRERERVLQGNRESGTREKEREWGMSEKSKRESLFRDAWWGEREWGGGG